MGSGKSKAHVVKLRIDKVNDKEEIVPLSDDGKPQRKRTVHENDRIRWVGPHPGDKVVIRFRQEDDSPLEGKIGGTEFRKIVKPSNVSAGERNREFRYDCEVTGADNKPVSWAGGGSVDVFFF